MVDNINIHVIPFDFALLGFSPSRVFSIDVLLTAIPFSDTPLRPYGVFLQAILVFDPCGFRPTPCTRSIFGNAFGCLFQGPDSTEEGQVEYDQLMSSVEKAMDKIRELHLKNNEEELIHNNSDCHHFPDENGICQPIPELDIRHYGWLEESNE